MKKASFVSFLTLFAAMLIFTTGNGYANLQAAPAGPTTLPGKTVYIWHDVNAQPKPFVAPPDTYYQTAAPTADIQINFAGSWPAAAQSAFNYAASIWENQLVSTVPIVVEAEFAALPPGALGGAGPTNFYRSPGLPFSDNTWYPVALANALLGVDNNGSTPEIGAAFSNSFNWYYGTDGNPPSNQFDFVSVALHEIGHGLGFTDSMDVDGGIGSWGSGTAFPFVYDRFLENGGGTSIVNGFANNSAALATQITSNNIYFDGSFTNSANGGPAKLYAPSPYAPGSSIAHLDEIFNGTPNSLMTFSIGSGEANHNPGDIALGMFRDMGWGLMFTPPTFSDLPAVLIQTGTSKDNAIDLWNYTVDSQDADSALTFAILSQSDPTAGVTLDSNRYIDVNPTDMNWTGSSTITVQVTDTDGLMAEQSFVVISGDISNIFLPIVLR